MKLLGILHALPISGIEAQFLADVDGLVPGKRISLFEPPAGQWVPFVEPVATIAILLEYGGMPAEQAAGMAKTLYAELRSSLTLFERPVLYTYIRPDMRDISEYVPLSKLLKFFQGKRFFPGRVFIFLEQACETTISTPMFRCGDFGADALSLAELPDLPPPRAMTEFFVTLAADVLYTVLPIDEAEHEKLLTQWKETMRPVAEYLEKQLGEAVYYFADPDCDYDDDDCHRFLALHFWCSFLPDSSFVRYLLEATGLSDVEELKAALIAPANYTQPWKIVDAFSGIEASPICHFQLPGAGERGE